MAEADMQRNRHYKRLLNIGTILKKGIHDSFLCKLEAIKPSYGLKASDSEKVA
jgi:hypothetical protein